MVAPLFAASMADLTRERIRALVAGPDQVESQTLEFKREYRCGRNAARFRLRSAFSRAAARFGDVLGTVVDVNV